MDPYRVLGIDKKASQDEIAKAYRTLASKHHPDRNPENPKAAEIKFKEITAAWEKISTEDKRKSYDFYGEAIKSFSFRSRNSVDDVFDNILEQFFGSQKRGPSGYRIRVKISLREAFLGCEKKVFSESHKTCDPCKGTGSSFWEQCGKCSGRGFVLTGHEHIKIQSACSTCQGRGSVSTIKCEKCLGKGYEVDNTKEIIVKIPPGVEEGSQVRLAGESADGGDLFVIINIDRDPKFSREGNLLMGSLDVPFKTLVMGGGADFELFGSKISIKVPPKTSPGSRMKIKGQGMPMLYDSSVRGDLVIEIKLKMPGTVTKEYEKLLDALAKLESRN